MKTTSPWLRVGPWIVGASIGWGACSGEGAGTPPAENVADPTWGTGDCAACVRGETACAAEIAACGQEPTCAAYLECLEACPSADDGDVDAPCGARCPRGDEAGAEASDALDACRAAHTGTTCPSCGDAPPDPPCDLPPLLCQQCPAFTHEDVCIQCTAEQCCESRNACLASAECKSLQDCYEVCNPLPDAERPQCYYDCEKANPAGYALSAPTYLCQAYSCKAECGYPQGHPCGGCVETECIDGDLACYADAQCGLLASCVALCEAPVEACIDACFAEYPDGKAPLDAFFSCVTAQCPAC